MPASPSGIVTFLFTDIEGSTRLWEKFPDGMRIALSRHDALLHAAIRSHHGVIVKTTGDGLVAAFDTATDAIFAVIAAQRALLAESWAETDPLRVRMAVHTGEAERREHDYFGPALNRTARLMAVAAGGQCVLSQATADLVHEHLPAEISLRDLGEHRLKDLTRPEHIFQIVAPDLVADFPPLRSLNVFTNNLPVHVTRFVGRQREIGEVLRLVRANRLVTLTGMGGSGKTRLAQQVAGQIIDARPTNPESEVGATFKEGIWFVALAALSDPALVADTVARVFDLNVAGHTATEAVCAYLRNRQVLLILDNCEHVIGACATLAEGLLQAL